jgi:hypothetical protein
VTVQPNSRHDLFFCLAPLPGWHKLATAVLTLVSLFSLDNSCFDVVHAATFFVTQHQLLLISPSQVSDIIPQYSYLVNTPKKYPALGTAASYVGEYDHMKRDTGEGADDSSVVLNLQGVLARGLAKIGLSALCFPPSAAHSSVTDDRKNYGALCHVILCRVILSAIFSACDAGKRGNGASGFFPLFPFVPCLSIQLAEDCDG